MKYIEQINSRVRALWPELDAAARALLVASHEAWLEYRDSTCDMRADANRGGTLSQLTQSLCLTELTKERAAELAHLLDERPHIVRPEAEPFLLTAATLQSKLGSLWEVVTAPQPASEPSACGQALPARDGQRTARRTSLRPAASSDPYVSHEIVRYDTTRAAVDAVAVMERIARTCSSYEVKPSGRPAELVRVAAFTVPARPEWRGLSFTRADSDGPSGSGAVTVAIPYNETVSYLTLETEGGLPLPEYVREVGDAVSTP